MKRSLRKVDASGVSKEFLKSKSSNHKELEIEVERDFRRREREERIDQTLKSVGVSS